MNKIRSYIVVTLAIAILGLSFLLSAPRASEAAPSDKDVVVVNTPADPVPVSVQGTVQSAQNGAWNVGLTGTPTVQVGNAANAPVLVRDVDNPARHPYTSQVFLSWTPGNNVASADFSAVPAGKRLVLEYVAAEGSIPQGQQFFMLIQSPAVNGFVYPLVVTKQASFAFGPTDIYTTSQPVRIYIEPGTTFRALANRNDTTGGAGTDIIVSVTGYLVDVP